MAEEREYRKPLFKAAGKNSFFEVFDNTGISKMSINLQLNDETTHKATARVQWYMGYEEFAGFCAAIQTGQLDAFLALEKGFPSTSWAIPPQQLSDTMRQWSMKKTDKGNYQVSVLECENEGKWNKDAKVKGKASFFINPFDLLSMATKLLPYVLGRVEYPSQASTPSVNRAVEASESDDFGLGV